MSGYVCGRPDIPDFRRDPNVAWRLHHEAIMQRLFIPGLGVALAVLSLSLVIDALVVTDQEKLEAFVDDLTDEAPDRRVDGALHYADTSRVDVEVTSPSDRARYGDGQELEFADHLRDALASLDHGSIDLLQHTVRVDGDDGMVAFRVDTDDGVLDAEFRFVRRPDGWLLRRVRVR